MKKTEWYDAKIKPVRKGYYEVSDNFHYNSRSKYKLIGNKRFFDGKNWRAGWDNEVISIFGEHDSHKWRGLSVNLE